MGMDLKPQSWYQKDIYEVRNPIKNGRNFYIPKISTFKQDFTAKIVKSWKKN